jgi:ElaB/YqjD/DUF883 family membrane-anchored ribosome-binding protein
MSNANKQMPVKERLLKKQSASRSLVKNDECAEAVKQSASEAFKTTRRCEHHKRHHHCAKHRRKVVSVSFAADYVSTKPFQYCPPRSKKARGDDNELIVLDDEEEQTGKASTSSDAGAIATKAPPQCDTRRRAIPDIEVIELD